MTTETDTAGSRLATIMTIYEAFGRGDVPTILDCLADDVRWDDGIRPTGLAYLQPRRGKDQVAGFFGDLAASVELSRFDLGAPCAGPDQVIVPIVHAGRNVITGREIPDTVECHLWTFDADGLVASFTHVFDYAVHERAAEL